MTVLAVLVIIFVVVPVIIWMFIRNTGGGDRRPVAPIESRIAGTEAGEMALRLFEVKNPDVNDVSADAAVMSILNIADNCGRFDFEVSAESSPYRVILRFEQTRNVSEADRFENTMVKYSCALLALIENADEIEWSYPADETGDTGGYFTRSDAEKLLSGVPAARYSESAEGVQLLLTELGLDE